MKFQKKGSALVAAALIFSVLVAGCAPKAENKPTNESTLAQESAPAQETAPSQPAAITVTDDMGRTVSIEKTDRVAALLGSYAEVWLLAGGSLCAAPDDIWVDYDLEIPEDVVNLGTIKSLSLEQLFQSEPDLIIASSNSSQHVQWQPVFEDAEIPVLYFDVNTFEDYLRMLKVCTDLTGHPELYQQYGTEQEARIQAVLEQAAKEPAQKVLSLRASAAKIRAKNSHNNVMGEMLADMGCINIADSDETLLENLNIEHILLENPDKILIVETGDDLEGLRKNVEAMFRENPLWQELDAVKNGKVYYMEKPLYQMKPNARWAEAYEKLAELLYEDVQ